MHQVPILCAHAVSLSRRHFGDDASERKSTRRESRARLLEACYEIGLRSQIFSQRFVLEHQACVIETPEKGERSIRSARSALEPFKTSVRLCGHRIAMPLEVVAHD